MACLSFQAVGKNRENSNGALLGLFDKQQIVRWLSVCLVVMAGLAVLPCQAFAVSELKTDDVFTSNFEARELFQTAFANRYLDAADFPGYEAEVSVKYDHQIYQGRVLVNPDYHIDIYNIARNDARNYALEQLTQAHAQHRPVPFEVLHGNSNFTFVGTGASGLSRVEEHGPDVDASYLIQNDCIMEVTRHFEDVDVTVTTLATIQPAAGYLPTEYREVIRDRTTGKVLSARDFRDYYMKVSKYFLLHRRLLREADSLELLNGKPIDETAIIITGVDAIPSTAS